MNALLLSLALSSFPTDSLYQIDIALEDQSGAQRKLSELAGEPTLIAMFYATCPRACPLLIADVKSVLAKLDDTERKKLRVVLVSLNPEQDTPAVLRGVVQARGLDGWTLMRASVDDTRLLATALGVRYRSADGGAIEHTSKVILLDSDGRIRNSREPQTSTDAFVSALRLAR